MYEIGSVTLSAAESEGPNTGPPPTLLLLCPDLPVDRKAGHLARATLPEIWGPYCSAQAVRKEPGWWKTGRQAMKMSSHLRQDGKQLKSDTQEAN